MLRVCTCTFGKDLERLSRKITTQDKATTQRQTWIDQARWSAIMLVVIGHAVGLLRSYSDLAVVISNFVYMFHIPVLVLLAGWGAQRTEANGKGLRRIFWQLLVPYVIFQLIAFALNFIFKDTTPSWVFTSQTFGLWFLVALAGWRLMAPWFRGIRCAVPVAVLMAVLAGLSPDIGGVFSLSRILVFFPLFLAGPWIVDKISNCRHQLRYRLAGAAVLLIGGTTALLMRREFWRTPFLGSSGYEALEISPFEGTAWRLLVLVVGTILAAAFMLVLPGRSGATTPAGVWIATAGRHTMYPYLLHLPLLTVVGASMPEELGNATVWTLAFCAGAAVFCAISVAPPAVALTRILIEPKMSLSKIWRPASLGRAASS
jgi:fucose 4-O-acetylase-like acetyltransferase